VSTTARFVLPKVTPRDGIGPGWTVALVLTATANVYALDLVSPTGHVRQVRTVHAVDPEIDDWSLDHQRVAISSVSKTGHTDLLLVDLAGGPVGGGPLPNDERFVGFNFTDGTAFDVMGEDPTTHKDSVSVLPNGDFDANGVAPIHTVAMYDGSELLAFVNGKPASVTGGARLTVLQGGRTVVAVPAPSGDCRPVRIWSATAILAACAGGLWSVPIDGAKPQLLSKEDPGIVASDGTRDYPWGVEDVYAVGGARFDFEMPSCGSDGAIARVGADLLPHRAAHLYGVVLGSTTSAIYFIELTGGCVTEHGTVYRYQPSEAGPTTVLTDVVAAMTVSAPPAG
jgi:hypothetical protein